MTIAQFSDLEQADLMLQAANTAALWLANNSSGRDKRTADEIAKWSKKHAQFVQAEADYRSRHERRLRGAA